MLRSDRSIPYVLRREWIALHAGDSLSLRRARGLVIAIAAAGSPNETDTPRVWLTEEGLIDDVFLHPGEQYRIAGAGRVALTAWGAVRLRLIAEPATTACSIPSSPHPRPQPGAAAASLSSQSLSANATACGASAMRL